VAIVPAKVTSTPPETTEQQFQRLYQQWEHDTAYISSSTVLYNHPAYQAIIRLGQAVVPLLLRDMEKNHTHWFCALREITGENGAVGAEPGNIASNVEAWLRWAKEKGYRW